MCSYKSSRIGERIGSKMKSIPSRRAFLAAGTKSLSPEIKMILAVFGGDGRCGSLSGGYQRQHDFKPPEQCAGGKHIGERSFRSTDAECCGKTGCGRPGDDHFKRLSGVV